VLACNSKATFSNSGIRAPLVFQPNEPPVTNLVRNLVSRACG
jgi:hypothetical protein